MNPCLCEHGKHFEDEDDSHVFGALSETLIRVRTPYGEFDVCPECRRTCCKDYPEVPNV